MFKQNSLENISKMLYGNKYNKKEENNSFLNQSKDNNSNNYKIKPIKDSTPQELLYGVKDKGKERKNSTPIEDLKTDKNILKEDIAQKMTD